MSDQKSEAKQPLRDKKKKKTCNGKSLHNPLKKREKVITKFTFNILKYTLIKFFFK